MSRTTSDARLSTPPPEEPPLFGPEWPGYLNPPIAKPRTSFVLCAVLAVALAFDLAIRSGVAGVAGAGSIALASIALVASRRLRTTHSKILVAAAPLFGLWLVFRSSPWLFPFDAMVASALVLLGVSLASGGSLWDMSIPRVVARALQALTQAVLAPSFLLSTHGDRRRTAVGIVRGLLIALPILLVLGLLLASADAVFRSFVKFDAADVIAHIVLLGFASVAMAALFRLSSVASVEIPGVRSPRLGAPEWTVVLVALDVLLAAFAAARLVALSEGGRRVIRSAGLTYAEYARSGFFQLLFAAVVVVGVLAAVRAVAEAASSGERTRLTALSLAAVALTLILVVSAFQRLVLYEGVFGLTMLRLYVQAATVGIGIVVLLFGVQVTGLSRRTWIWSAAGITALVLLFSMNVGNPEAFVVRYNVSHQTARFDPAYLSALSDDPVPELAKHPQLARHACGYTRGHFSGWASYNVSHAHAEKIRSEICKGGKP